MLEVETPDTASVRVDVPILIRVANPRPMSVDLEVLGDIKPILVRVFDVFGFRVRNDFREIPVTFGTLHLPANGTLEFRRSWDHAGDPLPFRVNAAYFIEVLLLTREPMACRVTRRIWITD